ncbi:MAG: DUF3047 domain-containing protein [Nitrospirales bacterium]|nr:DUF3047 domain-containing protein [Nitrospirales bacterium]
MTCRRSSIRCEASVGRSFSKLWLVPIVMVATVFMLNLEGSTASSSLQNVVVLEDFQQPDADGFPIGWEAQRSQVTAMKAYGIQQEQDEAFLSVNGATQRVYKRVAWDPRTMPVVTWRWRVRAVPDDAELIAAVYVSLDTDLMVIPVATKYTWSLTKPKGTLTEGGLFGAAEVVVRSGDMPVGEWVEERVNAYQDFLNIHDHEPAPKAWGISLLGGPGVEIDFDSLMIHAS